MFDLPPEDDPRRQAVRDWIAAHPKPTPRQLAESGYVAPHWPRPWGLDADPVHQLLIEAELKRAGIRRPAGGIGFGWAAPTIIAGGTQEQKDRYLMPILAGEQVWCQLFSEPGAGSDLANLGTRAIRSGDVYVVNGQKIWTSGARGAMFGILIARTDPEAPKHEGISYFICPMDTPGIEIRPIREMTGSPLFNEVFFTDVRIPAENLVGQENRGWSLAKVTLANERVSLSTGGVLWGGGPTAKDLVDAVRSNGGARDAIIRQRLMSVYIEGEILRLIRQQTLAERVLGRELGPSASIQKCMADLHGQKVMTLAKDIVGAEGMLAGSGLVGASHGFLFARALTIGGGTTEVQKNIIGERVLGLPHDIDVESGKSWAEARATRVGG
jgi:alkylation response protein AidB-like acyl-CoA dehydrogenase